VTYHEYFLCAFGAMPSSAATVGRVVQVTNYTPVLDPYLTPEDILPKPVQRSRVSTVRMFVLVLWVVNLVSLNECFSEANASIRY
jgi:hypothetical protein